MWSSRVWLSITALLSAVMIVWTLVSVKVLSPVNFGAAGSWELFAYGVGFLIPALFWLHIFFRPRGQSVIIGGRFALSVGAFLVGAEAAMVLLYFKAITPLPLSKLPTWEFALFVVCIALSVLIWPIIFFVNRGQKQNFNSKGF